jgi:uroporphyrinogen-III synthase
MGMASAVEPLFTIRPLPWEAPQPAAFGAILLTSANAARAAGPQLAEFTALPCYAVGETTAAAAIEVGFGDVRTGPNDGQAALAMAAADGMQRLLHLCGRDHIAPEHPGIRVERRAVYAAEAAGALPPRAVEAIAGGALVLIHSARAGAVFARLAEQAELKRGSIRLVAISPAAAAACGSGWKSLSVAAVPRDEPLLELAAKLCQTGARETGLDG